MGQMLSDEGDQDEAINYLIDALRWDSKNAWALLMMGNIFAKFKFSGINFAILSASNNGKSKTRAVSRTDDFAAIVP